MLLRRCLRRPAGVTCSIGVHSVTGIDDDSEQENLPPWYQVLTASQRFFDRGSGRERRQLPVHPLAKPEGWAPKNWPGLSIRFSFGHDIAEEIEDAQIATPASSSRG